MKYDRIAYRIQTYDYDVGYKYYSFTVSKKAFDPNYQTIAIDCAAGLQEDQQYCMEFYNISLDFSRKYLLTQSYLDVMFYLNDRLVFICDNVFIQQLACI